MINILAEAKEIATAIGAATGVIAMFGFFIRHTTNKQIHCSGKPKVSQELYDAKIKTDDERNKDTKKALDELADGITKTHERIDAQATKSSSDTLMILNAINGKG